MKTAAASGTLLLAPLSVALEWRAKGIGAASSAKPSPRPPHWGILPPCSSADLGYYGRFGFHSAASISYPGVPGEYTLACELTPGALRNISGAISLPDC